MRAIIPLFCASLNLFCSCPPSSNSAVTPQPIFLNHIAATKAASSITAPSNSNPTLSASTPNPEDPLLAFLDTESPLFPHSPDNANPPLSKRSVLHFASKPACKDSAPSNRKRGLIDRISNKFQKQPAQPNCIPHPLFALRAARTTELNRREEFDRAVANAVERIQAPIKQSIATKLTGADGGADESVDDGAGGSEREMWRRSRWDKWFALKREELLELFGRAWAVYLV